MTMGIHYGHLLKIFILELIVNQPDRMLQGICTCMCQGEINVKGKKVHCNHVEIICFRGMLSLTLYEMCH